MATGSARTSAPLTITTPRLVASAISSARSASRTNRPVPSQTAVPAPRGSRPASGANQVAVARKGVGSAAYPSSSSTMASSTGGASSQPRSW